MLSLVVLVAAAAGPLADERPRAAAVCPDGDAPTGEMGALEHTRRLRTVDVKDGHALVTFEDVVENRGPTAARLELALGSGGVVRAASVEEPGLQPRPARLDDVEKAAALFSDYTRALTAGVAAEDATDSRARAALLVTHGLDGEPIVSIAAPCSVRRVIVRVEMLLSSRPVDGAWLFRVPGAPADGVANELVVDSARPIRVLVEGSPLAPGSQQSAPTITEADEDGALTLVVKPLAGPRLRARGFAVPVSPTPPPADADAEPEIPQQVAAEPVEPVVVARAELDLPRPLADAPAGLRLVFVVDTSVSVGTKGVAKALQIVNAVLDEAPPDARFAIVSAGRRPRVVVPAWSARDERELPALTLENGSDVLAALKKARAIAGDVGDDEVARVIAVSDMQLRFIDDDGRVARGFASRGDGTRAVDAPLAHVVVLPDDADIETPLLWQRAFSDDDPRAAGPESTGGIWVDAGGEDESTLFPHLIHPTRLDRPRVTLGGVSVLGPDSENLASSIEASPVDSVDGGEGPDGLPMFLVEGSGLRVEVALPSSGKRPRDLRVGGLLWATPLNERVRNDQSLLGLLAVDAIGMNLDDDLVRTIAQDANVVSRVTSLVEVPDFRPAERTIMGFGGTGGCCCGGRCGGSRCTMGVGRCGTTVDLRERETLEELLREDARACLVSRAVLVVEVGDEEILAIAERDGGTCVVERFWQRRLDLVPHVSGAFVGHKEITVGVDVHDG